MASRWAEVQRGELPIGCGCYVVYVDDAVVYVGSTERLEHRCRVYRRKPQRRASNKPDGMWRAPWGYVPMGSVRIKVKRSRRLGDWLMWEYRLIARLQPRYNLAGRRDR